MGLFKRKPRSSPAHSSPSQPHIRELEQELGLEQSPSTGDLVDQYARPDLVECTCQQCKRGRR